MGERNQYIEKVRARIAQWDAEIDRMKAKADEAEADARIEYEKQMREMQARRDEGVDRLEMLREASDEAWKDVRSGFDRAWDEISGAFDRAMSRY